MTTMDTQAADWTRVCNIKEIPVLGARQLQRPQGPAVALFRTSDERVFALLDRCPHKGGPLSQGLVFGHAVACPLHNWTIALDSGQALAPDQGCSARFSVQLREGEVWLRRSELDSLGLEFAPLQAGPCGA